MKIIKKIIVLILIICLSGCEENNMETSIFKTDFFEDVSEITLSASDKVVTSEESISEILNVLKKFEAIESEKSMEGIYGGFILTLKYSDGKKESITYTGELLWYNDKTYVLDKEVYNTIQKAFFIDITKE